MTCGTELNVAIHALPITYICVYVCSVVCTVLIAIYKRQVRNYIPILCNAGAWYPSYYIFGFGLSFSAALLMTMVWVQYTRIDGLGALANQHANQASVVFGTLMPVLLGGMGIVSFHDFEVVHNLIAIAYMFISFIYQLCILITLQDVDEPQRLAWRAVTTAISVVCLLLMFIPARIERARLRAKALAKADLITKRNKEREERQRQLTEQGNRNPGHFGATKRRTARFGFTSAVLADVDSILAEAIGTGDVMVNNKDDESKHESTLSNVSAEANINGTDATVPSDQYIPSPRNLPRKLRDTHDVTIEMSMVSNDDKSLMSYDQSHDSTPSQNPSESNPASITNQKQQSDDVTLSGTSSNLLMTCGAQPELSSECKEGFLPEQLDAYRNSFDKDGNPIATARTNECDVVVNYMIETKNPAARYPSHLTAWGLLQYIALASSLCFYGSYISDFMDIRLCLS